MKDHCPIEQKKNIECDIVFVYPLKSLKFISFWSTQPILFRSSSHQTDTKLRGTFYNHKKKPGQLQDLHFNDVSFGNKIKILLEWKFSGKKVKNQKFWCVFSCVSFTVADLVCINFPVKVSHIYFIMIKDHKQNVCHFFSWMFTTIITFEFQYP